MKIFYALFIGAILGGIAVDMLTREQIKELQDENQAQAREIAQYNRTIDGMKDSGMSDKMINNYIETGCIPFMEYVK